MGTDRVGRRRFGAVVTTLLVAALTFVTVVPPAAATPDPQIASSAVVVRSDPGRVDDALRAVEALGGTPGLPLPLIDGFAAHVPTDRLDELRAAEPVVEVTANTTLTLHGTRPVPAVGTDAYRAWADEGSMLRVNEVLGTPQLWRADATGAGIDVALIDSGVAPVPGLELGVDVVHGPDLSFDSQVPGAEHVDGFGHGTHMASLIAGDDGGDPLRPANRANGFYGVAPGARVVSIKVADERGHADVSQVIAAIDWVVQHRDRDGLNIRVLSLSFGTESDQPYTLDPLAFAAEVAWRHGIVVVAAVGNDGTGTGQLSNPAYDPFVIAVGAVDANGTRGTRDDELAEFSSRGDGARTADLVAPGVGIQGLRVPGSFIDEHYPAGRLGERFFRGTGTSQATALVAGAAATLLSQRPALTPDQVKRLLMDSARAVPNATAQGQGAGLVDLATARRTRTPVHATQPFEPSTGTGTLEAARGGAHLVYTDEAGVDHVLEGEQDIFGAPFDSTTWAPAAAAGTTWNGGTWNGNVWTGEGFTGSAWNGATWESDSWASVRWTSIRWRSLRWTSVRWRDDALDTWESLRWTGIRWRTEAWG